MTGSVLAFLILGKGSEYMEFAVMIKSNGIERYVQIPISFSQLELMFGGEFESYEITEFDFPLSIKPSARLEDLNEYARKLDEIPAYLQNTSILKEIYYETGWNIEDFFAAVDDLLFVEGSNPTEAGHFYKDELGMEPDNAAYYFDYEQFGKDMLSQSLYVRVPDGYVLLD